jgi:glycosyltransferase involved in cell wall biosynthesis
VRITIVCDYRSPIARSWADAARMTGAEVSIISSRAGHDPLGDSSTPIVPLGPEALAVQLLRRIRGGEGSPVSSETPLRPNGLRSIARRFAPLLLPAHAKPLRKALAATRPDVVHALRLPYEAMATVRAWAFTPIVASVWGNDFTLHAERSRLNKAATRQTLQRIQGLHTDCFRDQRLAVSLGFDPRKPTLVVPGSGGIVGARFSASGATLRAELGIPSSAPVILNARGLREYVHLPEFIAAAKLVLRSNVDAHLICTGMRGYAPMDDLVSGLGPDGSRVHLLGTIPHSQMPALFRSADIALSLTSHDGTPNTLLEAMASGCYPIVGPVESVQEWVTDHINGRIVPPRDSIGIARAILESLADTDVRDRASNVNAELIRERADRMTLRPSVARFYEDVFVSGAHSH